LTPAAEVRVLSEVISLMMVFGGGRLTVWSDFRRSGVSLIIEVTNTAAPAGTSPAAGEAGRLLA
jgi:hypothetical protein